VPTELPAPHDRSGWAPHASERHDFYHRIRVFPREVAAWRRRMLRHVLDNPGRFPQVASASAEEIEARLEVNLRTWMWPLP
jgi:hypothetical protein